MRPMKQIASLLLLVLTACSTSIDDDDMRFMSSEPVIEEQTNSSRLLRSLPKAAQKISVSVYSFDDQTGQHMPNDRIAEFSRAVTQGGLAILNKALIDAGERSWFTVVERGGLQNLLQERSLIRAMRDKYRRPDGSKLPGIAALKYAGVLLEGGIIAYESNTLTGGIGARYLGIGGSTEYRSDIVTVALRAVNVQTGEVFISVTASKTIFSTGVQGSVFRFVAVDKLLEAESGFTVNEPPQLAVRQAVEAAVYALIMEGVRENYWSFEDKTQGRAALIEYLERLGYSEDEAQAKVASTMPVARPVSQTLPERRTPRRKMLKSPEIMQPPAESRQEVQRPMADKSAVAPSPARDEAQAKPSTMEPRPTMPEVYDADQVRPGNGRTDIERLTDPEQNVLMDAPKPLGTMRRQMPSAPGVTPTTQITPPVAGDVQNIVDVADDNAIKRALRYQFSRNEYLRDYPIGIESVNGQVTLRGQVPNAIFSRLAYLLATKVPGVKRVANNITISEPVDIAE